MAEGSQLLSRTGGVGGVFAEFAMLPDVLGRGLRGPVTAADWTQHLARTGFNEAHLDREDMPRDRSAHARFIAHDAIRFCEWLDLLSPAGNLTAAGGRLAELAALAPPRPEGPDVRARELAAVLAEQLDQHYLGAGGLPLVRFLQDASAELAAGRHPWSGPAGGLLLAEVDTLLWWGFADADRAAAVAGELAGIRYHVLGLLAEDNPKFVMAGGEEAASLKHVPGPVSFSDAVAIWHYDKPELAAASDFSLTEVRATAMALVFAELLAEKLWRFEISVLAPSEAGSQ